MRRLTLTEHRPEHVRLTPSQVQDLRQLVPSLAIGPPLPLPGDEAALYEVQPGSTVGTAMVDGLAVEICPKIGLRRLLFLLSFAIDPKHWRDQQFDFPEEASLVEAMVPGFCKQLDRALARGVLQGYRTEEDALPVVRGRLRFDDQLRNRFGLFPPVEVRYDEFTEDIDLNRILKAAIAALGWLPLRSEQLRAQLRHHAASLRNVTHVHYEAQRLPTFTYDRLTGRYRDAVELAKLILRLTSVELGHGETRSAGLLVNMNKVFEDFVVVALREALDLTVRDFPQGARGRRLVLDTAGRVHLQPDLTWWSQHRCRFVGDVKYKRTAPEGNINADLYQLLAYTVATGLDDGLLIYAAGEADDAVHDVALAGKHLAVTTLDPSGEPDDVLREIEAVAAHVRTMADKPTS